MAAKASKARTVGPEGTLAGFAKFLRQYMKAWPALIACLIGPLGKYFHFVPMYRAQENLAAGIVAVYGFLLAAALFYYRPALFRRRTFRKLLPAALILISLAALLRYVALIQTSIREETDLASELGVVASQLSPSQIMARTGPENIPQGSALLAWYLSSFFAAESALIVLALLEYVKPRK